MAVTDEAGPRGDLRRWTSRRARTVLAGVVAGVALLTVGWTVLASPQVTGGGIAGAWSADHEIVHLGDGDRSTFVIPAGSPGETMLAFEVVNAGRLPMELVEVWPATSMRCVWTPTRREIRDDPETMWTYDSPSRPAEGVTLPAGGTATLWLTGAHPDPDTCPHAGLTSVETVTMTVSVLGRRSTIDAPLGYRFGWVDEPEAFVRDMADLTVSPPTDLPG